MNPICGLNFKKPTQKINRSSSLKKKEILLSNLRATTISRIQYRSVKTPMMAKLTVLELQYLFFEHQKNLFEKKKDKRKKQTQFGNGGSEGAQLH